MYKTITFFPIIFWNFIFIIIVYIKLKFISVWESNHNYQWLYTRFSEENKQLI